MMGGGVFGALSPTLWRRGALPLLCVGARRGFSRKATRKALTGKRLVPQGEGGGGGGIERHAHARTEGEGVEGGEEGGEEGGGRAEISAGSSHMCVQRCRR